MKKIVIVEDNKLYQQALKNILIGFEVVGEVERGDEVFPLVKKTNPDLLILDLSLPKKSGTAIVQKLKESFPNLKILVLTIFDSEDYIQAAIRAGVNGYCLKDESRKNILLAMEHVLKGGFYFSPQLAIRYPWLDKATGLSCRGGSI